MLSGDSHNRLTTVLAELTGQVAWLSAGGTEQGPPFRARVSRSWQTHEVSQISERA